jgi:hypothetical protein
MLANFETMKASWNKLIIFFHIQTYQQLNFDNFICKPVLKISLKCELIYKKKYLEASPKCSPDYKRGQTSNAFMYLRALLCTFQISVDFYYVPVGGRGGGRGGAAEGEVARERG